MQQLRWHTLLRAHWLELSCSSLTSIQSFTVFIHYVCVLCRTDSILRLIASLLALAIANHVGTAIVSTFGTAASLLWAASISSLSILCCFEVSQRFSFSHLLIFPNSTVRLETSRLRQTQSWLLPLNIFWIDPRSASALSSNELQAPLPSRPMINWVSVSICLSFSHLGPSELVFSVDDHLSDDA